MYVGRLIAGGVATAALVAFAGTALELQRFGTTDAAAADRVQARVLRDIAGITALARFVAHEVATDPSVGRNMPVEDATEDRVRTLFDVVAAARQRQGSAAPLVALTIYDRRGARAWAGRPSDLPRDRSNGPASLFVTPSPLGLRLVYVEPILAMSGDRARLGTIAVEHVLSPSPAASTINNFGGDYVLPGQVVPVLLRTPVAAAASSPNAFVIRSADGSPLLQASIDPDDLREARDHSRRVVIALVVGVLGVTMLLLIGPLLDRRVMARTAARELQLAVAIALVILASTVVLWGAAAIVQRPAWNAPLTLLFVGAAAAAVVATTVSGAVRLRVALRTDRRWPNRERAWFVIAQLVVGGLLAAMLVAFEQWLGTEVDPAAVDLRHFTLHPWGGPRLAVLSGILLCHAAVMWAGALGCVTALTRWRLPRSVSGWHIAAAALWVGPTVVIAVLGAGREWPVAGAAIVLAAFACALAALVAPRLVVWYRQTTVASRILALFMAFLLPALLIYPSVHFFAERATRRLIATRYAPEAMSHPQALLSRLNEALAEIDRMTTLPRLVAGGTLTESGTPRTDSAFFMWSRTVLARARLTSDIELYGADGALVSRFALNFPEYTGAPQRPAALSGCRWDVFGEAQLFGAQERNMLHAERRYLRRNQARRCGRRARHLRLPYVAVHQFAIAVLRCVPSVRSIERDRGGADRRRRLHGVRLGPDRDLHVGQNGVAVGRRDVFPHLQVARSVLDGVTQGRHVIQRVSLERPLRDLRARVSASRYLRAPGAAGRADDARGGRLRHHPDRQRDCSRGSRGRVRQPGGRCSVRSAPASIASCFLLSYSPRSCRC